jgi:archaellum biogenesis ATPase FlaH/5S rRNA maturation endonuclease (ribonuclease M5)
MHAALLLHDDAMEYLTYERGFSVETIKAQKLGVDTVRDGKTWLVYPFFHKGNLIYAKWRTLPPLEKDFRGVQGRETPLYNEDVIAAGMEELFFVEGEADCVAMLNQGIAGTVGVPGANHKKASWLALIDKAAPKKMYMLYDTDKVGQAAAKEMATRIDIAKVCNIVLPPFETELPDGTKKDGKDINEWFRSGHTLEEFRLLVEAARPFEVAGVTSLGGALQRLVDELEGTVVATTGLDSPWPSLNKRMGKLQFGDMIGILADAKQGKSSLSLNWLEYLVNQGHSGLFYCLEMTASRLARKWVSHVMQVPDSMDDDTKRIKIEDIRAAMDMAAKREADMLFGFTNVPNPKDEVFDVIRQAVRRYGIKVVVFDNLQMLSRSEANATAELNILSKKFKALAMELDILLILIVQPNRVGDNVIVSSRNVAGSSAVEKDVDTMICLHRARIGVMSKSDQATMGGVEVAENFAPEMLVRVDLSRYAAGGTCNLWFDGETSTVSEMSEDRKAALPKPQFGNTYGVESEDGGLVAA